MQCAIYRYRRRPEDEPGNVPGFLLRRSNKRYDSKWQVLNSLLLAKDRNAEWSFVRHGDYIHIPLFQYPLQGPDGESIRKQCNAILHAAHNRLPKSSRAEPAGVTIVAGYPEAIPGGWAFFVGLAFEFSAQG